MVRIKMSDLASMSPEEQSRQLSALVKAAQSHVPNQEEAITLREIVANFESWYGVSTNQLIKELAEGVREKTSGICDWLDCHLQAQGKDISIKQVYPALRTLSMENKIRKLGRGRYSTAAPVALQGAVRGTEAPAPKNDSAPEPKPVMKLLQEKVKRMEPKLNVGKLLHATYVELYTVRRVLVQTVRQLEQAMPDDPLFSEMNALLVLLDGLITKTNTRLD